MPDVHASAAGAGNGEADASMGDADRRGYAAGGGAARPSRTGSGCRRGWERREGESGLELD